MSSAAPKPPKPIKLFCGYSHEDAEHCLRFRQGIKFLEYDGHIEAWYDGKIIAGQEWDKKIKGQLELADIIVFLVSHSLLASQYAYNTELRRALRRMQDGKARLVPVIVGDCPWELTAFHNLQALPAGDGCKPLCQWPDPNAFWANVVRGLWQAVEELRAEVGKEASTEAEPSAPTPPEPPAKLKPKAAQAAPPHLIVDIKGGGDYRTIREALAAAKPGSRIMVRPGEYNEGIVLNKEIEIIGDGPRDEIVVVSRDSNCIKMATDKARVANLTLRCRAGEQGKEYYGVDIPKGKLRLENCDISSDSLSCLAVHGPRADPEAIDCRLHDGKSTGIFVYEKGLGRFKGCDIFGNSLAGVEVMEESNPIVTDCKIHDGKAGGVFVQQKGLGLFEGCDIFGNAYSGVEVKVGSNPIIKKCKIYDGKQSGVYVHTNGLGLFEICEINGNAVAGVSVKEGGHPSIKKCRINRNGYQGVWVRDKGSTGTFLDNDLSDNALSAWKIEDGCQVERRGNIPNE